MFHCGSSKRKKKITSEVSKLKPKQHLRKKSKNSSRGLSPTHTHTHQIYITLCRHRIADEHTCTYTHLTRHEATLHYTPQLQYFICTTEKEQWRGEKPSMK